MEPETPAPNRSPQATIESMIGALEARDLDAYAYLLTKDFSFEFSGAADPGLVHEFSDGWGKEHEVIALLDLFQGGVNSEGEFLPAASRFEVSLQSTEPTADTTSSRTAEHHRSLYTAVQMEMDLGERTFVLGRGALPTRHRLYLVRGDAAESLGADQPSDAGHWYIHHWKDEAPSPDAARTAGPGLPFSPGEAPVATHETTWGALKAWYH